MPRALRFLEWIKGRRAGRGPGRWLRAGLLQAWKAARRLPGARRLTVRVRAGAGLRMKVRCFSYDDLLVVSPHYEQCIARELPPRGTAAVDAGAFLGLYALRYAAAVGPAGRVVAVEPHARNFRLLEENVRLNGFQNVSCVRCALGRASGEAWLAHGDETSTASTVPGPARAERVPAETLDALLDRLGVREVSLVKIDVEGAELDVLEGARETLARCPGARLIVEVHAPQAETLSEKGSDPLNASRGLTPFRPCPVAAWLGARGYAVETRRDGERVFYVAARPLKESCSRRRGFRPP